MSPVVDSKIHPIPSPQHSATAPCEVRIASQFGVEWVKDHEHCHSEGACQCSARFERYQPRQGLKREATRDDGDPFLEKAREEDFVKVDPFPETLPQLRRSDIATWKLQENAKSLIFCPYSPQDYGYNDAAEAELALDLVEGCRSDNQRNAISPSINSHDLSIDTSQVFSTTRGDSSPATPVPTKNQRAETWTTDTKDGLSMPPADAALDRDSQKSKELPLVGLPLGAGPEGCLENSHARPWTECRLNEYVRDIHCQHRQDAFLH
jgi:hypothetical protein